MKRYLPAAYSTAIVLMHVLTKELKLNAPRDYVLTETPDGRAYLFAVMDEKNIGKSISKYTNDNTLHQLSTALKGRPVRLSNTTGLRYAVELSPKREIPSKSLYPGSEGDKINIGLTGPGQHFLLEPQTMQNILLVGDMGSGKSNFLRLIALAALENDWELFLADPEENTFGGAYWDSVSSMGYVAGGKNDFIEVLDRLHGILNERRDLYQKVTSGLISPNSLADYNARAETPLKRIVMIADEANSYFNDPALSEKVFELARRSRKWGVNLVLAAHSWRGQDISTSLRSMLMTRIALHTEERGSAEVVLGQNKHALKALRFREPGRGIIRYAGQFRVFQTHLVPDTYQATGAGRAISNQFETLIRASMGRAGEENGKLEIVFAMQELRVTNRVANTLLLDMENQGLLEKRPDKANARYLTQKAREVISLQS